MKILRKLLRPFVCYLLLSVCLSIFLHSEILFNQYNYGRHWDWSLLSTPTQYQYFVHQFFFSIKQNYLGVYTVVSVGFSEFLLKLIILSSYNFFSLIGLEIGIPVINKFVVFVVFTQISTVGIWFLTKKILKSVYDSQTNSFFLISIYLNLIYSFSLVALFDLHGGALNRQISTALLPWFFLFLYDYSIIKKSSPKLRPLIKLICVIAMFDVSNIFFALAFVSFAILTDSQTLQSKLKHLILLALGILLTHLYWLHSFVLPITSNLNGVLYDRKFDLRTLVGYSSQFSQTLFLTNTSQGLIKRAFPNNPLIYFPFFSLLSLTIFSFSKIKRIGNRVILLTFAFIFSTVLVGGVFAIANIYLLMYKLPFLGFIRGAIRYAPNLAAVQVFIFLCAYQLYQKSNTVTRKQVNFFGISCVVWFSFLIFNSNWVNPNSKRTAEEDIRDSFGALYEYNSEVENVINNEKLVYNVLHEPSWLSPIFASNIYPKTSQGSITESNLRSGVIYTFFFPLNSNILLQSFSNSPEMKGLFAIANIKYSWENKETKAYFPVPESFYLGKSSYEATELKEVPIESYLHRIYIPNQVNTTNLPIESASMALQDIDATNPASVLFVGQNGSVLPPFSFNTKLSSLPTAEFKQINSTLYQVKIHKAKNPFALILSSSYHSGWVVKILPSKHTSVESKSFDSSKTESFAASEVEKDQYIKNGELSHEKLDDFISIKIGNSIQNNNLVTPRWFERFKPHFNVTESHHLLINGYANAWILDPEDICNRSALCEKNKEGEYEFELLIDFWPQQVFLFSLIVSFTSLIVMTGYSFIKYFSDKH